MKEVHQYMVSFSDMPCLEVFSHLILFVTLSTNLSPFPPTHANARNNIPKPKNQKTFMQNDYCPIKTNNIQY